jgi:transposase
MDRAYHSNALRAKLAAKGIVPVIPPQANRLEIMLDDKAPHQQRNQVERLFTKIKLYSRVATRDEKLTATFSGFVILALTVILLR